MKEKISCEECRLLNIFNKKCKGEPALGVVQGFDEDEQTTYNLTIKMPYSWQKNRDENCPDFLQLRVKYFRKLLLSISGIFNPTKK